MIRGRGGGQGRGGEGGALRGGEVRTDCSGVRTRHLGACGEARTGCDCDVCRHIDPHPHRRASFAWGVAWITSGVCAHAGSEVVRTAWRGRRPQSTSHNRMCPGPCVAAWAATWGPRCEHQVHLVHDGDSFRDKVRDDTVESTLIKDSAFGVRTAAAASSRSCSLS